MLCSLKFIFLVNSVDSRNLSLMAYEAVYLHVLSDIEEEYFLLLRTQLLDMVPLEDQDIGTIPVASTGNNDFPMPPLPENWEAVSARLAALIVIFKHSKSQIQSLNQQGPDLQVIYLRSIKNP